MTTEETVQALEGAFERSGLRFRDQPTALAAFQQNHQIVYDESNQPFTTYQGQRLPLHLACESLGLQSTGN